MFLKMKKVYSFFQHIFKRLGKENTMKKTLFTLSMLLLLVSPAYANQKADTVPLTASVQDDQASTLDDSEDNEKPKKKKKATKKVKKHKKAKKVSN